MVARPRRSAAVAASEALASGVYTYVVAAAYRADTPSSAGGNAPRSTGRAATRGAAKRKSNPVVQESEEEEEESQADSDSSLSEPPDEDDEPAPASKKRRAGGGGARAKPAQAKCASTRVDVSEMRDNELFNAVMVPEEDIGVAAENWVILFQSDQADAVAQLVTFTLRLSGCSANVDSNTALDLTQVDQVVEEIQSDSYKTSTAQYPVVSRSKVFKGVRRSTLSLIQQLFHDAAEAEIMTHESLLDPIQAWVVALSSSPLRSFRHTATLIALWMLQSLSSLRAEAQDDLGVAEKQRDAEANKATANRTRLAHTQQKIDQLEGLCEFLDEHTEELVENVFIHRFRDFDAAIRLDCVEQLGGLMKEFPTRFLDSTTLEHMRNALSDPDMQVRLHVLRNMQALFVQSNIITLETFMDGAKRRLVDMALGDTEMKVRIAAFSLLESANQHGMLDNEDRSALAVHVFDIEAGVRVAAASFLAGLVEHDVSEALSRSDAAPSVEQLRVKCLISLLVKYNNQLAAMENEDEEELADDEEALVATPGLGRIRIAIEALWDATEVLRPWGPYLDILLDEPIVAPSNSQSEAPSPIALSPDEEAVAVEAAVSIIQFTRLHGAEEEEGVAPIEACSTVLITALPKLLAKFSTDAPKISDILLIIQSMDLEVYHETRNVSASESLWEQVCSHFMRHIEPDLLQNAAEAIRLLSSTSVSSGLTKLDALAETILQSVRVTLSGRNLETAVFTEDDVHNLRANLLRLHALAKVADLSGVFKATQSNEGNTAFDALLQLSARGRLGYEHEVQFVRLSLKTLALVTMWWTKSLLGAAQTPEPSSVTDLDTKRCSLLHILHEYVQTTAPHVQQSLQNTSLQLILMLYALFFSLGGQVQDQGAGRADTAKALRLECPSDIQQHCTELLHSSLNKDLEVYRSQTLNREATKKPQKKGTKAETNILSKISLLLERRLLSLASTFICAVRVGAIDIKFSYVVLGFYAHFNAAYNAQCHELVNVLRDEALHADRAWIVCETILNALKQSFNMYLLNADEGSEAHFISLSRQLANATMVRGPGFSVLQAIDPDAMVTLHVAACQLVLSYCKGVTANQSHEPVFFKALANLGSTLSPVDAMKIRSTVRQRFAKAHVEPQSGSKEWEPFFSYERRLLTLASKDPNLVNEANLTAIEDTGN